MRKFLLFSCFVGLFCLAGCSSKKSHMPTEDEILQKVSESVPVEQELKYVSEADLIKHPIVEYTVWVPFVQVYANGKT